MGVFATTVLGPVAPEALGPTLLHEHLLCDLRAPAERGGPEAPITLADVFEATYRPMSHPGNHRLGDVALAGREAALFAAAGGGTIVELTTGGIAPDPQGLAAVSRASGVHVVLGAGFYTEGYQDAGTLAFSVEALTELMTTQVTEGAWETAIRCGIIGEIGCSWPLTPFERGSLQAAALAAGRTGAAVTVHPGRHPDAPHEILDVLDAAGADLFRVVMGHMDRTYEADVDAVLALARRGCVVEYDFFGVEMSAYWMGVADLPNDCMRVRAIARLFDAGLGDRVAISHDICTKARLAANGGHGYAHLLANVVPLMRDRGFGQAEIDRLLVGTPRRLLTIGG